MNETKAQKYLREHRADYSRMVVRNCNGLTSHRDFRLFLAMKRVYEPCTPFKSPQSRNRAIQALVHLKCAQGTAGHPQTLRRQI